MVIKIVVVQNVQIYLNIGVEFTSQVPEIREKMEQNLIQKYGGIGAGSTKILNKMKQTIIETYNRKLPANR